jgi:SRSO17 transposase
MDLRATKGVASRFAEYVEHLSEVIGHVDRHGPLASYCTGLLLPGDRKSVEPMAARIAPGEVGAKHQSLHHFVAKAPWDEAELLSAVRTFVLPKIEKDAPIRAWIIDDTGIPKKGKHSVGVARQYCGELGKQDNCQVAVTLSVASDLASLPVALRLYLPEPWANDKTRRSKAGIPDGIEFQTKPRIALDQVRQAIADGVPKGVALADAGYGNDTAFRSGLTDLGLEYVVGVQGSMTVWAPEPSRCQRGHGVVAAAEQSFCVGTATSNRSRYRSLPRAWPAGRGRRCVGVRAPRVISSRASLTCAFVRRIEIIGVPNRGPRNGC